MKPLTSREDGLANRARFDELLSQYGLTQKRAAEMIAEQTGRPCSVRTVRAWLNDESSPSWRPCPQWSISALEGKIRTEQLSKVDQ